MKISKILNNTMLVLATCLVLTACASKKVETLSGQIQGDVYTGTDSVEYLESAFDASVFDKIIPLKQPPQLNEKLYFDGAMYQKLATFNNRARCQVYDLTPYDETLLLDTDYIISNSFFICI
mgnify:CR=1 FL=1